MTEVKPFIADHLRQLALQPSQRWMQSIVDSPEYLRQLEATDTCTVFIDGVVAAICSIHHLWSGRAELVALVSQDIGPAGMLKLHRAVKARLDTLNVRRLEATVDGLFLAGHRWLLMLGFKRETPNGMPGYLPDGSTSYLYARVR